MTNDNIITREEAAIAMLKGEKVETCCGDAPWRPTTVEHFDKPYASFRKPPEPRRVAREWWIQPDTREPFDYALRFQESGCIHVREVLPGDVVLQRMTEAEIRTIALRKQPSFIGDSVDYQTGAVTLARTLGLIGEGS